jgi:Protein of unknown function (DUF3054)
MMNRRFWRLIAGDGAVIALIVVIGFASHRELETEHVNRMLVLFVELLLLWVVFGLQTGVFKQPVTATRFDWRVPMTMLMAAPFAALMRSVVLRIPVVPAFILVITAVATLGITLWRFVWVPDRDTRTFPPLRPETPERS